MSRSLRLRLPLFILVLLGAIAGSCAWFTFRDLSRTLERAAGTRVERASGRLLSMLAESVDRIRADARRTARNEALAQAIRTRDAASLVAARRAMTEDIAGGTGGSRSLWTRGCERVLDVQLDSAAVPIGECPLAAPELAALARDGDWRVWIQPLAAHGEMVRYDAIAPVLAKSGDTLGYFVERRMLRNANTGRAIGELIGRDVRVLLGNASGPALWTDLSRKVQSPAIGAERDRWTYYDGPDGSRLIGVARNVPHTPWVVLVTLPRTNVMEPVHATMRQLGIIVLVALAAGLAGAWLIGRHVTSPLRALAGAADA
ncbi:MAG TPA: hypothetical protein VFY85_14200, partial [Gemmatimonadaceae bacterium]|nr:hypothetical protein [Gemmatimonadaceae bacterium]